MFSPPFISSPLLCPFLSSFLSFYLSFFLYFFLSVYFLPFPAILLLSHIDNYYFEFSKPLTISLLLSYHGLFSSSLTSPLLISFLVFSLPLFAPCQSTPNLLSWLVYISFFLYSSWLSDGSIYAHLLTRAFSVFNLVCVSCLENSYRRRVLLR